MQRLAKRGGKTKKRIAWNSLIVLCLVLRFFVGFYQDREFPDLYVFLKHRPTYKMMFHSPLGEADPQPIPGREGYLNPFQQLEERDYVEFVQTHRGYERSVFLPFSPSGFFFIWSVPLR